MSYIIGVVGPCGSGKSTLSRELKKVIPGSEVIHFDDVLKALILRHPKFLIKLFQIYGLKIIKNGKLNDGLVTLSKEKFECLYEYVYPLALRTIKERIENLSKKHSVIILDFFLLPRTELWGICDKTILLNADSDLRHERVSERDNHLWSKDELIGMDKNIGVDYDNYDVDIKINTKYVLGFFCGQAQEIISVFDKVNNKKDST